MDADKHRRLLDLLRDEHLSELPGPNPDPLRDLLREARDEALVEAKALLKQMLVQAILEQALGTDGAAHLQAADVEELTPAPLAAPAPGTTTDKQAETHEPAAPTPPHEPVAESPVSPDETPSAQPEATPPGPQPSAETAEALSEIEEIKRKIAENEALIARTKKPPTPPASSEPSAEPPPPAHSPEDPLGYYVYAILDAAAAQPDKATELPPLEGIDPAYPVYIVPHMGLRAAVSQVWLSEFGDEALKERLEDLDWVEAHVRRHQTIIETLMRQAVLIPLRFCTIYRNEARVRDMIAQEHEALTGALARLRGRQEWGIKAFCAEEVLTQKVAETSQKVQQFKADIAKRSSGAAYFARKKVDELIEQEVERLRDEYAQLSHDRLAKLAVETRINSLQRKESTGRQEEMVMNAAYLVAETSWEAFRAELSALEAEYGGLGIVYELTGPWPPYNFCQDAEIDSPEEERNVAADTA